MTSAQPVLPWRVLIVDDSRDDADLTTFALRDDGGLAIEALRVDTLPALRQALDSFAPHLMLCDLNIPGLGCSEALAVARGHQPQLPVVVLTGCLMPGDAPPAADALVLKDDPAQMIDVVRRLLATRAH